MPQLAVLLAPVVEPYTMKFPLKTLAPVAAHPWFAYSFEKVGVHPDTELPRIIELFLATLSLSHKLRYSRTIALPRLVSRSFSLTGPSSRS